ncbi:MAG: hypothetical protein KHW80_04100 [Faecalibacterium sp.]|nr:hypothetical protein [Faecalibacterium sp.]
MFGGTTSNISDKGRQAAVIWKSVMMLYTGENFHAPSKFTDVVQQAAERCL